MAIGSRDLEKNLVEVARRDTKEKMSVDINGIENYIKQLLDDIQIAMFQKAKQFQEDTYYLIGFMGRICTDTGYKRRVCICTLGRYC